MVVALLATLISTGNAQASTLIAGPPEPDLNGLPAWYASPGVDPCAPFIDPPLPDPTAEALYYALEARGTNGGLQARYVARLEGLPGGLEPPVDTTPVVLNEVIVRLDGATPGTTYTIEEPLGVVTTMTPAGTSLKIVEGDGALPEDGPIQDLSIRTGMFRVSVGATVLIELEVTFLGCEPFAGDPMNAPPVPAFSTNCLNLQCRFDASASTDDGGIVSYSWNFGDGSTGTGRIVTHDFAAGGNYTVALTVLDTGGLRRTVQHTAMAVSPLVPPVARFSAMCDGARCTFDASASTDFDGRITGYLWRFGDGFGAFIGPRVTYTYSAAARHEVTLVVTDNDGLTNELRQNVDPRRVISATFQPSNGNNWWVQVRVTSNVGTPSAVCAMVNSGPCVTLNPMGSSWAISTHAPTGSIVTFRATWLPGETVTSGGYNWPSGTPVGGGGGGTPPPTFAATFTPHGGNAWWVQTRVSASQPLTGVCASVNNGPCQPLVLRPWGSWAEGLAAPTGSQVRFTATSNTGATATSTTYIWPK